jgi:uncharacterized protein
MDNWETTNHINTKYIVDLEKVLVSAGVDGSHGLDHCLQVLKNVNNALTHINLGNRTILLIRLATLLHDADDAKYFPNNEDYENARMILQMNRLIDLLTDKEIEFIIWMIGLVSFSKNGDSIPQKESISFMKDHMNKDYLDLSWTLYPRYADRLEAIGVIGLKRTFEYTLHMKRPLYLPDTPRAVDEFDLFNRVATQERYDNHRMKNSASMMDHFYDKLLRLSQFPIRNEYFDKECAIRIKPLIDIALEFGKTGTISASEIEKIVN